MQSWVSTMHISTIDFVESELLYINNFLNSFLPIVGKELVTTVHDELHPTNFLGPQPAPFQSELKKLPIHLRCFPRHLIDTRQPKFRLLLAIVHILHRRGTRPRR